MKNVFCPKGIRNFVASSLAVAIFTTSLMVALAAPNRPLMGELTFAGASGVTVNGERAAAGRSISSSSIIATSSDSSAIINLGATGRIELAPNSSLSLNFDEKTISGSINDGNIKISSAPGVEVKLAAKNGEITNEASELNVFSVDNSGEITAENGTLYLNNGETVTQVDGQQTGGQTPDDNAAAVYLPVAILAGAVATIIIIAATQGGDDNQTVSPIR
ncbi:MAG: hypothetical protein M3209_13900 [Acidobacteriota bacterium]|nr:hypothetical protein [Acidobacteriota bacterium]